LRKIKQNRPSILIARRAISLLVDDKGLDLFHQIIAVVGIDFHGNRLGQIQAEDTEDRLGVNYMTAGAKINVIRMPADNVDKGFYILSQAQFDVYGSHAINLTIKAFLYHILYNGHVMLSSNLAVFTDF
jgi:hypothetical protein